MGYKSTKKVIFFKEPKQEELLSLEKALRRLNSVFYKIQNSGMDEKFNKQFKDFLRKYNGCLSTHEEPQNGGVIMKEFLNLSEKGQLNTSCPESLVGLVSAYIGEKEGNEFLNNKNLVIGLKTMFKNGANIIDLNYRVDFDPKQGLHINVTIAKAKFVIKVSSAQERFRIYLPDKIQANEASKFKFWIKMTVAFYRQEGKAVILKRLFSAVNQEDKKEFAETFKACLSGIELPPGQKVKNILETPLPFIHQNENIRHAFIDSAIFILARRRLQHVEPDSSNSEIASETPFFSL